MIDSYYFDNFKNNCYTLKITLTTIFKVVSVILQTTIRKVQKIYFTNQSLDNDIKSDANNNYFDAY